MRLSQAAGKLSKLISKSLNLAQPEDRSILSILRSRRNLRLNGGVDEIVNLLKL